MRTIAAFLFTATPAFAHADQHPHVHGIEAFWPIAGVAIIAFAGLSIARLQKVRTNK